MLGLGSDSIFLDFLQIIDLSANEDRRQTIPSHPNRLILLWFL
jgi:hypothetical protein